MSDGEFNDIMARACFASDPRSGRGRRYPEPAAATRTDFQRDRDRIIHSTAFRRLALKTQVFLPEQGDHFRTRLTHTIEVAQIARSVARALKLDEDLAEALALAHDLGHTPFGHTGEDALGDVLKAYGGFDHNAQTLRIVVLLERRYPDFDGLNLTWDTLDGLIKRNMAPEASGMAGRRMRAAGASCFPGGDAWTAALARDDMPSAEAQTAAVADDIAYNAHDVEDGLQAGLFDLADLDSALVLAGVRDAVRAEHPGMDRDRTVHAIARRLVGMFVDDVIAASGSRLRAVRPASAGAVRALDHAIVAHSPAMLDASRDIKAFLFERMYRHPRLLAVRRRAKRIMTELAQRFVAAPELLPASFRISAEVQPAARARHVADYLAGLTDRAALSEHRRLFDATPDLI